MKVANDSEFHVNVTINWTEHPDRSRKTSKKCTESKVTSNAIQIFNLSRADFISSVLSAHGLQDRYAPGSVSGPGMRRRVYRLKGLVTCPNSNQIPDNFEERYVQGTGPDQQCLALSTGLHSTIVLDVPSNRQREEMA